MSALFFVLSVKYSKDNALWWRPNMLGYTTRLDAAGRYTAEEVAQHRLNDGKETRAIPCVAMEAVAVRTVPMDSVDDWIYALTHPVKP